MASAKLRQLDDRVREIRLAQKALRHILESPHDRLDDCPTHQRILRAHADALAAAAKNKTPATAPHPSDFDPAA